MDKVQKYNSFNIFVCYFKYLWCRGRQCVFSASNVFSNETKETGINSSRKKN